MSATNERPEGEFEREERTFRDRIGEEFPAESDRYHLYISRACPWAHGTVLVRALMGLEDAISVDVVDPYRDEEGWRFSPDREGCTPDTVNGFDYLREVYEAADPSHRGRVTVPVLWDTKEETIVNNESIEIMRMIATEFRGSATRDVDLYPGRRRDEVDEVVDELYEPINNGVYRAGFARSQRAYDRAVEDLFGALDRWNDVLGEQRYLLGERLTLADLRLFPTLVRFDHVYHTTPTTLPSVRDDVTEARADRWKRITGSYPDLHGFTRDVYQTDGVPDTVNLDHIVEHYGSPGSPPGFDPVTVDEVSLDLEAPHGRD